MYYTAPVSPCQTNVVSLTGVDVIDVTMMYDASKTVEIELVDYFTGTMAGCRIIIEARDDNGYSLTDSEQAFTNIEEDSTKLRIFMGAVTEETGF